MSIKEEKQMTTPRAFMATVEIQCDICGKIAPHSNDEYAWGKDYYDRIGTVVSCSNGYSYPEGGTITKIKFDICPECFKGHIIPFMATLGAVPRKEESDW